MKQYLRLLAFLLVIAFPFRGVAQYSSLSIQELLDSADVMQDAFNQEIVKELLVEIESRIDKATPQKTLITYYITSGIYDFESGDIPKAQELYNKALKLALEIKDSTKIGIAYSYVANVEVISGLPQKSIEYYKQALDYYTKRDDDQYYAILLNMSLAYSKANSHEKALSNLMQAKDYFSTNKDFNKLAVTENNIGEIYRVNIGDIEKAQDHYQWAIVANKKINNQLGLAQNYHNLSNIFLDISETDSAIYYAEKSRSIKQEIAGEGAMASANYLLASTYSESGYYDKAIEYYKISLQQCEEYGYADGIFHNKLELGEVYFLTGEYEKSIALLEECVEIAIQSGQLTMLESVYTGLYEVHKANGNIASALEYYERKYSITDSIKAINESENLNELRAQYEADLAEAENMVLKEKELAQAQRLDAQQNLLYISLASIALLLIAGVWLIKTLGQRNRAFAREKKSNTALAEQYQKLKASEIELAKSNDLKNKILSVLGHDLRTPLSSISSLLSTMSAVEITREELHDLLGHLKKEVDISLTTLHEILAWARLQMNEMTKQIRKLNPEELLNEVVSIYDPNIRAKQLQVKLEIEPDTELYADYNQMRSICGNLLSNAIKFTPTNGEVKISVKSDNEFTEITFCDSGLGIPEDVLQNLNERGGLISNTGTSGENGTGIGLRIVTDFVNAHNGVLRFKNNADIGTTVSVNIPKQVGSELKTA